MFDFLHKRDLVFSLNLALLWEGGIYRFGFYEERVGWRIIRVKRPHLHSCEGRLVGLNHLNLTLTQIPHYTSKISLIFGQFFL